MREGPHDIQPMHDVTGRRIGYVLRAYPRLSETFIVQEILQMEARGAELELFAFRDPGEALRNPAIDSVRATVHYLIPTFRLTWPISLLNHAYLLVTSPTRYLAVLRRALGAGGSRVEELRHLRRAGRLARSVQKLGIEHLHAHFANKPASVAYYASLLTGVPFSFTAHAKDLYLTDPATLANRAEHATFLTTCTAYNASYLRDVLPSHLHSKVHTVYHGVDTRRFTPRESPLRDTPPTIVSVGRLVPKKGYVNLIAAAEILQARGVRFRLDIYGEGELWSALQQQIEAAGLAGVARLCGPRTQDELIAAYRQADVFALASIITPNGDRDGIPNVLLEAMALGLPAVSTAISGIPEVITDGEDGLLVPPGDPDALADALASLLTSPPLRTRLGRAAGRSIRQRFDADANAAVMASLLNIEGSTHADRVYSR